jgi:hypothetical protein
VTDLSLWLFALAHALGWALAYVAYTYLRDWLIWHMDGLCIRLWMAVSA